MGSLLTPGTSNCQGEPMTRSGVSSNTTSFKWTTSSGNCDVIMVS